MKEFSAGALIFKKKDQASEFLLIYSNRNKEWGFPKGHIDAGETEKEAALREIKEETGLIELRLIDGFREELVYKAVSNRDDSKGSVIEKSTIYFLCETKTKDITVDADEITDFKWLMRNDALKLLTFDSLKKILRKADAMG
jgi:8-oxo-dGTP pyrophosphatase MutT (NUDIX family)